MVDGYWVVVAVGAYCRQYPYCYNQKHNQKRDPRFIQKPQTIYHTVQGAKSKDKTSNEIVVR